MKLTAATLLALAFLASPAAAHGRHHHHYRHHYAQTHREGHREAFRDWGYERRSQARRPAHGARYATAERSEHHETYRAGYGGRPSAWCGWFMRQVEHVVDPAYNLARNWAHWGRPAGGPTIGAIVVWPHHVGKIVGQEQGKWVVLSGNDGHRVRTRPRSLAGAIAFRI